MGVHTSTRKTGSGALSLLICFGLAAAAHVLWLLTPLEYPQPPVRKEAPVVTAYVRELPGGWSPTLFSLPSPTGFSGAMKEESFHTVPPLQSPLRLTESLRASPPEVNLPEQPMTWGERRTPTPLETVLPPPDSAAPPERAGWRVDFLNGPDTEVRITRLPGETPQNGKLELSGEVSFDVSGRVSSLLVHSTKKQDASVREAVNALRRMRAPDAPPDYRFRFRFSYRQPENLP